MNPALLPKRDDKDEIDETTGDGLRDLTRSRMLAIHSTTTRVKEAKLLSQVLKQILVIVDNTY